MKLNPDSLIVETFIPGDGVFQGEPPETYVCDTFATTGGPYFCAAAC
jgi:hypothetical protein